MAHKKTLIYMFAGISGFHQAMHSATAKPDFVINGKNNLS